MAEPAKDNQKGDGYSLDFWVKQLTQEEMPVFAHTARIIAGEASSKESSASRLAEMILHDPSMTVRLMKMANSPFFNPRQNPINTVSRAIVVLGFNTVRSICMSIAILDSIVEGRNKKIMMQQLAESFHAAIQARSIAHRRKDKSPEEVFIATLLLKLGKFAALTFSKKVDKGKAEKLETLLEQDAVAVKRKIGFTFDDLTRALNKEWHLSPLLGDAMDENGSSDPRVSSVRLAQSVAEASQKGWKSEEMKSLTKRLGEVLYLSQDKVSKMLQDNAESTIKTLSRLGAAKVCDYIAPPEANKSQPRSSTGSSASAIAKGGSDDVTELENAARFHETDPALQIEILSDISQACDENPDINLIIGMILEGIYRGIGMDRCVFALLGKDKRTLKSKYVLGYDQDILKQNFQLDLHKPGAKLLQTMFVKQTGFWVTCKPEDALRRSLNSDSDWLRFADNTAFFTWPIVLNRSPIGIFYADRKTSGRELSEQMFSQFKLFCQQAPLALMKIQMNQSK